MKTEAKSKPMEACDIPAEEIAATAKCFAKRKAKIRSGSRFIMNTETGQCKYSPIIEVLVKNKRKYLPLSFNAGWYFANEAARDIVLRALIDGGEK